MRKLIFVTVSAALPFLSSKVALADAPAEITAMPATISELLSPGARRYAAGIRMGSFTVLPSGQVTVAHNDNVFATKNNRRSDTVTNVDAAVAVVSNWSRHALQLYAGGGGQFYSEFDDENQGYVTLGMSGVLDIRRDLYVAMYARYAFGYEERGSGESFGTSLVEPIPVHSVQGGFLVHKDFNRLWFETGVAAESTHYDDARISTGGVVSDVDQSFRDGTSTQVIGRVGYSLSPKTSVFFEGTYNTRDYDTNDFDATGYGFGGGIRYDLTRLLKAEAAIGYAHYNFDGTLDDVSTMTYRAKLVWSMTPLMQVALIGSRDLGTPSQFSSTNSNRITSDIGARIDYAWRRDVTFYAGAGYGNTDYVDIDRNDDFIRLSVGGEYQLRPMIALFANYSFTDLTSNVDSVEYDRNIVMVGVKARY